MPAAIMLVFLVGTAFPSAGADHAPPPRDLDLRVLLDTTASGDYGALMDDGALVYEGGHDFLALDVREAYGPDGDPGIYLRNTFRIPPEGDVGSDLEDIVRVKTPAGQVALSYVTSDGTTYTPGEAMEWVGDPIDLGDDTFTIDGFASYGVLGAAVGDELTDFRVQATVGGELKDHAPGTYFTTLSDVTNQETPRQPQGAEAGEQFDYTLQGPAELIRADTDVSLLDLRTQNGTLTGTLTLEDAASTAQNATVTTKAPAGLTVSLDQEVVAVEADGTATVGFTLEAGAEVLQGDVRFNIQSDLGGFTVATVPVEGGTTSDSNVVSDDLRTGDTFQHTFTTEGTFAYHCHPHPWMQGEIHIEPAQNGSEPQNHTIKIVEPLDEGDWTFEPGSLTIRVGDTVEWVNEGEVIHVIMGGVDADGDGHHHDDHDHGEESEESPALPLLLVAAALLAVAVRRRS